MYVTRGGKNERETTNRGLYPPKSSSPSGMSLWTKVRQSRLITDFKIARMFPKHNAELSTFTKELFVPVMQRTKNPFPFSNGKQDVVHRGPYKLTHSVEWVKRWKLMVSNRKPNIIITIKKSRIRKRKTKIRKERKKGKRIRRKEKAKVFRKLPINLFECLAEDQQVRFNVGQGGARNQGWSQDVERPNEKEKVVVIKRRQVSFQDHRSKEQ
jgi:hypothetical protein